MNEATIYSTRATNDGINANYYRRQDEMPPTMGGTNGVGGGGGIGGNIGCSHNAIMSFTIVILLVLIIAYLIIIVIIYFGNKYSLYLLFDVLPSNYKLLYTPFNTEIY